MSVEYSVSDTGNLCFLSFFLTSLARSLLTFIDFFPEELNFGFIDFPHCFSLF